MLDILDTRGTLVEPRTEQELVTMMDFDNDPPFSMFDMTEELWDGIDTGPDPDPILEDEDDPTVDHMVDDDDMEVTFND